MRVKEFDVTAVAGAASFPAVLASGEVHGIQVKLGSGVTSADVTVENMGRDLLAKAGITTDTYFPVREGAVTDAGTAITNSFVPYVWNGTGTITLANVSAATGTVTVLVFYR